MLILKTKNPLKNFAVSQKDPTFALENETHMSKKELQSYRLSSLEEPTDEMLQAIMEGVAREAKRASDNVRNLLQQRFNQICATI